MRVASVMLMLLVTLLVVGCGSRDGLPVAQWTIGARFTVTAPTDFGKRIARGGTITATSDVALPPDFRGRDLSLAINVHWCAPQLSIDGERIDDVARTAFENERSRGGHLYRIPARLTRRDVLPLRLDIVDTYTFCATFLTVPTLAAGDHGPSAYRWVALFNDVAPVAVITAGGLVGVAFLVFALTSRKRVYAWAAIAAIGSAGSALNQLGVWQLMVGWRGDVPSCLIAIFTEYAMLRFVAEYFEVRIPEWGLRAAVVVQAVAVVLTVRRYDLYLMFAIVSLFAFAFLALASWMVAVHGRNRRNSRLLLAAFVLSVVPVLAETTAVAGLPDLTNGAHTAALGQTIVSLAMLVAFARDFRSAQGDLEAELAATAARGREIASLNDELRRQIAERSRDFADALAGNAQRGESRELTPGEVIDGRYTIVRTLGRGGMGVVYEVERTTDGKRLALKSMTEYTDGRAAARFAHEAELVASVHHRNLVDIVDVGFARSGFLYLVMELVNGGSLETCRDKFGDVAWARPLLVQIARGLAALHEGGVVHRDLKPANVLLDGDTAKIADFGISRRDDETAADAVADTVQARHLTRTGALIGTPLYMAPELSWGRATARAATDIFSFGVLAHELLTGKYPWPAPPIVTASAGIPVTPCHVRASNAEVDARLAEVIDACLSVDPKNRPTTTELAAALNGDLK